MASRISKAKIGEYNWKLEPRWTRLQSPRPEHIQSPSDVLPVVKELLTDRPKQESVWCLMLDTANRVEGIYLATIGLLGSSQIDVRELFRPALLIGSRSIIMIHNHPSGTKEASVQDIEITKTMIKAGEALGIALLDSMIIMEGGYTSIRSTHPNLWS